MAIYSPPVRLGGTGNIVFLPAPPQKPPPSPTGLMADYMPGPWSIPFDADATSPPPAAETVFEQIEVMTKRFPSVGVSLCSTGSPRSESSDGQDRGRLGSVRALLARRGIRKIAVRTDGGCHGADDRPGPRVLIEPTVD